MFTFCPVFKSDNTSETILLAATELRRCLSAVWDTEFSVVPSEVCGEAKDTIYLGVNLSEGTPCVDDSALDDGIFIDIKGFSGVISGTNPRSVLIGAYRYLKELGFSFLRPGSDGEYFPEDFKLKNVFLSEKASYRHRGVCIEGSVFRESLIDIIDWLPKAAMNGYFIQFQLPRVFFDRWYSEDTPYREKTELTDRDILEMVAQAEDEIKKRDLLYHGVGHGWTSQAFGIDGTSWDTHTEPGLKYRDMLALVNGERALFEGVPLNTNLCYSNKAVREIITDNITDYCLRHPNLNYLHFWLADGQNNNCECERCRGRRTSDYYIQMLNELDCKLSEKNIGTKIVFLIYVDLLWKPLYEKLADNNRFVMMFAPISRSYSSSINPRSTGKMTEYKLNKLEFPDNVEDNLAYLRDWQQDFKCDSFDFDYHFMWDHYYDFAQYNHARVLCDDIKNLEAAGLNGLVSCQIQRAFLPTCVNMNVLAQTLWNKETEFDFIVDTVLKTEFGDSGEQVKQYLKALSLNCGAKALRGEEEMVSSENVACLSRAVEIIDSFLPQIDKMPGADKKILSARKKLSFHGKLYRELLVFYLNVAKGNPAGNYNHIKDMVLQNEFAFRDEFDAMYFLETFENHIVKNLKNRGRYNF